MKTVIIAVILLLSCARLWAQAVDVPEAVPVDSSCLVLWQYSPLFPGPGYAWRNEDSCKVDICPGSQRLQYFGKRAWFVYFRYYIIPVPDSVAMKGADSALHSWRDIDSAYSSLRDSFQNMEQEFGTFTIQHVDIGPDDTSDFVNKDWKINFNTYLNVDTVDTAISRLPDINPALGSGFGGDPIFYESVNMDSTASAIRIWPEPSHSEVHISGAESFANITFFDPLGRQLMLPIESADNRLTVDVSTLPNGVIYCSVSGKLFRILIQH